jgi:hypothetical protein
VPLDLASNEEVIADLDPRTVPSMNATSAAGRPPIGLFALTKAAVFLDCNNHESVP